jgi:hypothetical protein
MFFRKAKWMVITILFPEFIFAKAVAELQTAVENLVDLVNKTEHLNGWIVECGWLPSNLHRLYWWRKPASHLHSCVVCTRKVKKHGPGGSLHAWTLTHTYFANMGGLVYVVDKDSCPITVEAWLRCCIPVDHDPSRVRSPSEDEIKDKSKADWQVCHQ